MMFRQQKELVLRLGKQQREVEANTLTVRAVGHEDAKVPGVPQLFLSLHSTASPSS